MGTLLEQLNTDDDAPIPGSAIDAGGVSGPQFQGLRVADRKPLRTGMSIRHRI